MPVIQLRNVPDALYNKLKIISKKHHRTMSGETLAILEKTLDDNYRDDSIFSEISSVREDIRHIYGTSESSLKTLNEDRSR